MVNYNRQKLVLNHESNNLELLMANDQATILSSGSKLLLDAGTGAIQLAGHKIRNDTEDVTNLVQHLKDMHLAIDVSLPAATTDAVSAETTARESAVSAEATARTVADTALQNALDFEKARIDNILSNVDPASLDSLTEIVAAFQAEDSSLNNLLNTTTNSINDMKDETLTDSLAFRIKALETDNGTGEGTLGGRVQALEDFVSATFPVDSSGGSGDSGDSGDGIVYESLQAVLTAGVVEAEIAGILAVHDTNGTVQIGPDLYSGMTIYKVNDTQYGLNANYEGYDFTQNLERFAVYNGALHKLDTWHITTGVSTGVTGLTAADETQLESLIDLAKETSYDNADLDTITAGTLYVANIFVYEQSAHGSVTFKGYDLGQWGPVSAYTVINGTLYKVQMP